MRFFSNITLELDDLPTVFCDNMQTIRLLQTEAPKLVTKLKHIDIHQHWLRQEVAENTFRLEWIETAKMLADGFTKALTHQNHIKFLKQLNLVDVEHLIKAQES